MYVTRLARHYFAVFLPSGRIENYQINGSRASTSSIWRLPGLIT
jgi:hypothetical protein